jgi:D-glycero-alpha-D-manno-heptose-7-phosphate kinase
MIITRAPFRVSFFGGGTDYVEWYSKYGGSFLSLAINKYAYVTLRVKPPFLEKRYRVSWRLQEDVSSISKIKHPIVRHSLLYNKFKDGVDITYLGDLPSGTGMGSSSAFTVALNHALFQAQKKSLKAKDLAKCAYIIERKKLKEVIGIQDQIASAYGGFNYVKIKKNGSYNIKALEISDNLIQNFCDRCLLLHTGISRRASTVAEKKVKNIIKKEKITHAMLEYVKEGYSLLLGKKYDDFGYLLNDNWRLKKSLSEEISNSRIDDLYNFGLKNGALGGKLLGAGSGGFLLFFCKSSRARLNLIKKLNTPDAICFNLANNGSETVFKDYE